MLEYFGIMKACLKVFIQKQITRKQMDYCNLFTWHACYNKRTFFNPVFKSCPFISFKSS